MIKIGATVVLNNPITICSDHAMVELSVRTDKLIEELVKRKIN